MKLEIVPDGDYFNIANEKGIFLATCKSMELAERIVLISEMILCLQEVEIDLKFGDQFDCGEPLEKIRKMLDKLKIPYTE